jgi:hypothetical protein
MVPALLRREGTRAYLGVAPDQNFTFIVAIEPKMAFIVISAAAIPGAPDVGAVELSADRVDFYRGLRQASDGRDDVDRAGHRYGLAHLPASDALSGRIWKAIEDHLVRSMAFPGRGGPQGIQYLRHVRAVRPVDHVPISSRGRPGFGNMPDYAALQMATDADGRNTQLSRERELQVP